MKALFEKSLLHYFWSGFWERYYFKFVLPRVKEIELEGVRLDVSAMSPKARNRVLNCGYEAQEKKLCEAYLTADDAVVEFGGAIGFIGLFCQKKLGIKRYVVFEANPRTVEILRKNYRLNGFEPMVWHLALASEDGNVDLEVGTDFWENSILDRGDRRQGCKTVRVPGGRFRTLLGRASGEFNVLIIDVEGAEQFIDVEEIPSSVSKIILEFHPHLIGAEKMYDMISRLLGAGFYVAREEKGTFVFLRKQKGALGLARGEGDVGDKFNLGQTANRHMGEVNP